MFDKRKRHFGKKRKHAEEQAIAWLIEFEEVTEQEAKDILKGKRMKKSKTRKPSRSQRMR
jgi:hypothetical protein